jgi:hypothetical protein
MAQHKAAFAATAEDGQRYVLYVYTDYAPAAPSPSGPQRGVELSRQIRTSDGREVVKVRDGEYLIVQGDVTLRSDDPEAP